MTTATGSVRIWRWGRWSAALIAVVVAAVFVVRHLAVPAYEPLRAEGGEQGLRLGGWRATRLTGVQRCLSVSGGTVLRFGTDGTGQAEFALWHIQA